MKAFNTNISLTLIYNRNHEERPSADELLKHPFLYEIPEEEDNDSSPISA